MYHLKEKELSYQREGRKKTVRYATKARMATVNPDNLKAYKDYLRNILKLDSYTLYVVLATSLFLIILDLR